MVPPTEHPGYRLARYAEVAAERVEREGGVDRPEAVAAILRAHAERRLAEAQEGRPCS